MPSTLFEFKKFKGICNTNDSARIDPDYQAVAENVDIDDEYMLHRRDGYGDIVVTGSAHSLWADDRVCLFVHNGSLKRLMPDLGNVSLLTVDQSLYMEYVRATVNDYVYFTNNSIVGFYTNGVVYPMPDPDQTHKTRMIGGHLIEYYNGRLYSAFDDKIFYSDATYLNQMDKRFSFMPMPGRITLLKAVYDGLYVGAGNNVWYLGGLGGEEPPVFNYIKVSDNPVLPNSGVKIEGEDIGKGLLGTSVMWASEEGIWIGLPQGQTKNVTKGHYAFPKPAEIATGTGFYREYPISQYVYIWRYRQGYGDGIGSITIPTPIVSGTFS